MKSIKDKEPPRPPDDPKPWTGIATVTPEDVRNSEIDNWPEYIEKMNRQLY